MFRFVDYFRMQPAVLLIKHHHMPKIHITRYFDTVVQILKSRSLLLHYCREDFTQGTQTVSRAVHPVISFSAYRYNDLPRKKITYGKYGLAFSEDWVRRKRIHAVMYIHPDSLPAESLATLLRERREHDTHLSKEAKLAIMQVKCFIKNREGYNSHFNKKDFKFYRENEWRYVPSKRDIKGQYISESRSRFEMNPGLYNKKLKQFPLKFTLDDVLKIYVADDDEKDILVQAGLAPATKIEIRPWIFSKNP